MAAGLFQFDADGKIRRNEVYFDRSELLAAWSSLAESDEKSLNGNRCYEGCP